MTTYIALLRKAAASDFGVDFLDFPGCVTAGKTLDEARRMAVEALELHIRGMIEDHDPVPEPSSLDVVMQDPANRGWGRCSGGSCHAAGAFGAGECHAARGSAGADRSGDAQPLEMAGGGREGQIVRACLTAGSLGMGCYGARDAV
jgi:predicted RNase H-like HicB family nuclease